MKELKDKQKSANDKIYATRDLLNQQFQYNKINK